MVIAKDLAKAVGSHVKVRDKEGVVASGPLTYVPRSQTVGGNYLVNDYSLIPEQVTHVFPLRSGPIIMLRKLSGVSE